MLHPQGIPVFSMLTGGALPRPYRRVMKENNGREWRVQESASYGFLTVGAGILDGPMEGKKHPEGGTFRV